MRPTMFGSGRSNVRLPVYRPGKSGEKSSVLSVKCCLYSCPLLCLVLLASFYIRRSTSSCDVKLIQANKELVAAQEAEGIVREQLQIAEQELIKLRRELQLIPNDPPSRPGAPQLFPPGRPRPPKPPMDHQQGATGEDHGSPVDTHSARALLVICYNRPDYLKRALDSVMKAMPTYNKIHIYVSQDGNHDGVTAVIQEAQKAFKSRHPDVPFTHWNHPDMAVVDQPNFAGYYKLSQHFKWALDKAFLEQRHKSVIILEDDLEVSPDFFDYFTAAEEIVRSDPTLLAASAWNDLGQEAFVSDPTKVYRSDFFPGLGWLLTDHAWEELGPSWPKGFWDDWMREPPQRKGRAFLRPEISRSYTFGVDGVSRAQFFDQYLGNIKLNDVPVDWAAQDLSVLDKVEYDHRFEAEISAARSVSAASIVDVTCAGNAEAVKADYGTVDTYADMAHRFGFIDDVKAGVPRTAYRGVVTIKHKGCTKFLLPEGGIQRA